MIFNTYEANEGMIYISTRIKCDICERHILIKDKNDIPEGWVSKFVPDGRFIGYPYNLHYCRTCSLLK